MCLTGTFLTHKNTRQTMLETLNSVSISQNHNHEIRNTNSELTKLYDSEPYTAYTEDLEFMWRWTIYQDNKLVQEGCSLSLDSSRHAVKHVMAFFNMQGEML